jgi:hypothetical protein
MAEFKLERFKYTWKGDWVTNTAYKRDDVIRVGGKSYVCVITHVSNPAFRTDLTAVLPGSVPPQPQPRWVLMTSAVSFQGDWIDGIDYNLGDLVVFNGSLYNCIVSHTSGEFATDFDNWAIFAQTSSFIGDWATGITYAPGAVVRYNGNVHKCITAHISQTLLEDDATKWELFYDGVEVKDDWQPSTDYRVNDLVKYGATVFRCITTHTSNATDLDNTKFTVEIFGTQFDGDWSPVIYYNIGDIVRHSGFVYYAVNNNSNSKPYVEDGSTDWIVLARSYKFTGKWSLAANYKTGDVVLRGGDIYIAVRDIGGTDQDIDGSTIDYLETDTWELLVPGKSFKQSWTEGTTYSVNSVVYFKGTAYACNYEHTSAIMNAPGDNGSGFEYWDIFVQAGQPGSLRKKGDLITYGPSREIDDDGSTIFDDSTLGDTRVAIGTSEQILSVTDEFEAYWRNISEDAQVINVATNGIDAEGRGSFQNPFRTIRYAAEHVEDNFTPLSPVLIRVGTGKYEEIGPITVPAGCSINGDELRSTTVLAAPAQAEYIADGVNQIIPNMVTRLEQILLQIVTGVLITPTTGNTEQQITENIVSVVDADGNPLIDSDTGQPLLQNLYPASNGQGATNLAALVTEYNEYIEFATASGQNPPTIVGSNVLEADQVLANAGEALYLNRKFVKAEIIAYLKETLGESAIVNEARMKNDIHSLIRGLRRDTKYSGNYATIFAAKRYSNAVTGSQFDSLFLMRDTTGLRDLTTGGLQGTLNPPGVFDLYQKPTGGACVALDPGWGPADDRTWIINRSPYIQGVTNTGTGCVGQRIDGSLHEGGNKSMVSNDFTQVLSDGVGVWVSDNARAELVSVFTYYCQIGYFAEDGGVIRATNGNNSYGKYGAIADGVDATETPQSATLFTRNNEATVTEVFAGGANDQIKLFEYGNCGEEYSTASATIIGSGNGVDVEYSDFRNGALFEARLTSGDGSSAPGGGGYVVRKGNAQELTGASSTIKLAAVDTTQLASEILGMRLIITDGTGVGQYGYVTGFNFATKIVNVAKDSDDTAGWDHIIPGTPIAANLDLTTRYTIEPRVTASAPNTARVAYDLITNRTYVDLAYGDTTESYVNVFGGSSYIWQDTTKEYVTVRSAISPTAVQFNAQFTEVLPLVPFDIKGRTSGAEATVTAISANTGEVIEVDVDANGDSFVTGEEISIVLTAGSGDVFDDASTPAKFNVTRLGKAYSVTIATGGSGYAVGDVIKILGTQLGGTTPANDLTVKVLTTSQDSTNSILTFSSSGKGKKGRFVALTDSEFARYSDNGTTFTEVALPFTTANDYKKLIAGNNRFIAIAQNQGRVASTLNGSTWSEVALPLNNAWQDGAYGNGKFVIVGNDTDLVLHSTDGATWATSSIPDDTVGDSTVAQWSHVTYGKGLYVVTSVNDRATATSTDGINWTRNDLATPVFSGNITSVAYGKNRFVIVTDASESAYSFDGVNWTAGGTIPNSLQCSVVKYAQGSFVALGTISGTVALLMAKSDDGVNWEQIGLESTELWTALAHDNAEDGARWVTLASAQSTGGINNLYIGTKPLLRANVITGSMRDIKIIDPGSGYNQDNLPVITITDPNATTAVTYESRIGNRVLAQPEFINRGSGYRRTTSSVTISGDGYADIIPEERTITIAGVRGIPNPGVQITIAGVFDVATEDPDDLFIFSGVEIFDLGDDGTENDTRLIRMNISPNVEPYLNLRHATGITLRERFSQCRISGHDFLDIGTGNFTQTNYPTIYAGGNYFTSAPENEVYETNSGRVFYVSTDQDGNFRTGELFSVQQATGVVTISAQFFDLDGLSELALGGVRLGGTGTVVQEFSSDPTFAADSNNVIPTQRAIATFISDRLSVGGEALEVNKLQAGRVVLGGADNEISNIANRQVELASDVIISGTYETNDGEGNVATVPVGISGTILTQSLMLKMFDDNMQ